MLDKKMLTKSSILNDRNSNNEHANTHISFHREMSRHRYDGSVRNDNNKSNGRGNEPTPLGIRMMLAGISGMGAITVCHPLDVIRVQMQTEGGIHPPFRNTMDAAVKIYNHSGFINGLYAGISASLLRQLVYGSIRIGVYSNLLERARIQQNRNSPIPKDVSFLSKLGIGCAAGGIGSFIGTPTEVALVRMASETKLPPSRRRNYSNVLDCIKTVVREEGVANLWRGASPTVTRATLLTSCQLGITSELKTKFIQSGLFGADGEYDENGQPVLYYHGLPMLFCATLCSSFVANFVANPFDVVKSRMQQNNNISWNNNNNNNSNNHHFIRYSSMTDCFVKSVKAEGLMVLYSGFTPAFVKLAPFTVICLTIADKLTKVLTGKDAL